MTATATRTRNNLARCNLTLQDIQYWTDERILSIPGVGTSGLKWIRQQTSPDKAALRYHKALEDIAKILRELPE